MYFLFSYINEFGLVKLYFDKDFELNDRKGKYFF